jgi:hypothetical protein
LPEGGPHAPILIAISWQALGRALQGNQQTRLCNCTVVILFAGFYIEANLNYIVKYLGMTNQMESFLGKRYPGLQDKLAWFYNEFVARSKAPNRSALYNRGITKKIRRRFPGFARLCKFRNDISHGVINESAKSLQETQKLRQQAKDMAAEFFKIMQKHGHNIARDTNYYAAIDS